MNTIVKDNISLLAHEIKNPLTICNGYLSMINNEDQKTRNTYLEIIKEEINRSLLILSEFSKNNTLNLEIIDLTCLFKDIKDTLNDLFLNNDAEIIILDEDELLVEADYDKLKQVFINILKNSLEAKNNNKLLVVIKTLEGKDYYIITIVDNGIGMDNYELNNIGKERYTTKINGTGLGISFIKEIIEGHHGKVEYNSKKGIGTQVKIILPKEKKSKDF
ncbi:MAG: HAMP domain-containing histidine kinase [Bacilli bacterium]|nr:HAMP domain-containing histidine kinase [Bacilli bacterium]